MMTLVTMSLAAIALVRSVDSGALVLGNLAFKQDATAASNVATGALTWLRPTPRGRARRERRPSSGISRRAWTGSTRPDASPPAPTRLALVDWHGDGKCATSIPTTSAVCIAPKTEVLDGGSTARWVIMRLCAKQEAMVAGNTCSRPLATSTSTASERGEVTGPRITATVASPYYRIVVQVQGPRKTVSFTETIVHFWGLVRLRPYAMTTLRRRVLPFGAAGDPVGLGAARAAVTDIADVPLFTSSSTAVKPNLMFILDDSGSMANDHLPDEGGLLRSPSTARQRAVNGLGLQPRDQLSASGQRCGNAFRRRVHVDPEQQSERPTTERAFDVVALTVVSSWIDHGQLFRAARRRKAAGTPTATW